MFFDFFIELLLLPLCLHLFSHLVNAMSVTWNRRTREPSLTEPVWYSDEEPMVSHSLSPAKGLL